MTGIEHSPPPFFKRGPAPLALLVFYLALSLALLVLDLKFHSLEVVRQVVHTVIYPVQRLAQSPANLLGEVGGYLSLMDDLKRENERLHRQELDGAAKQLHLSTLEQENLHLRQLLDMPLREKAGGMAASILYTARDPFARRVIVDRGLESGVQPGLPVISEAGVVGQVTRAFPFSAEVTLITDKNQVIPVKIVRTGQRSVIIGRGDGYMELRYLPANADVVEGDEIVTSGLDGVFLSGLPLARVERVERETAYAFANILCSPVSGPENHGEVMILKGRTGLPERPEDPAPIVPKRHKRGGKMEE